MSHPGFGKPAFEEKNLTQRRKGAKTDFKQKLAKEAKVRQFLLLNSNASSWIAHGQSTPNRLR
jgi:hypothetical protein